MPDFPIIDTHLHLWDPQRLRYSWLDGNALLNKPYLVEDYRRDCGKVAVEAMVFLECYADFDANSGQYLEEIVFVEGEAKRDLRLKAIVPMAPLEKGKAVEPMLAEMAEKHPLVRGIRRIMEFDADPHAFTMAPKFIEGVNLLEQFGMHFEINVNYTQMETVLEFVKHVPNVKMILDHCGKPGIRGHHIEQYQRQMTELAKHPNVWCKLSDLPVEADWKSWTEADIRPFIDATVEAFGVDRIIYAGDWPVCLQATTLERWVEVLDHGLSGLSEADRRKIYRDNANRFYRLGL
jgi:L-fuconolactonase